MIPSGECPAWRDFNVVVRNPNIGEIFLATVRLLRPSSQSPRPFSLAIQQYNISNIRKYLSSTTTEILVHAFVSSKLDNCNSLLYGLPNCLLKKLQHVQNAAARLITLSRKHEHITPILFNLHWLPVNYRIIFKILLITYKALNDLAPSYVRDLLTPYTPSRQLRSSSKDLLSIPHFNLKTYGARSFSVAAPTLWNTLPSDIKNSSSVSLFKHKLKTFLFKKAFL